MKATLTTLLVSAAILLGACGGPDAKDPSKTDTTAAPDTKADPSTKPADTTTPAATDAKPATTDAKPAATDAKPVATDAKPATTDAKPADDGKCKDAPKPTSKDSKGCMAECSKLEAKA